MCYDDKPEKTEGEDDLVQTSMQYAGWVVEWKEEDCFNYSFFSFITIIIKQFNFVAMVGL
jgi:hypothetical protein